MSEALNNKGSKQIKVGCLVSNHIEMQPSNYQNKR